MNHQQQPPPIGLPAAACPICTRIAALGPAGDPSLIASLEHCHVMLHEQQGLPGWCVLWLKDHREHLSDLSPAAQAAIFGEVARVAGAIRAVVKPRRINYECLGNVTAHVHWHVIPRYQTDPEPRAPIWGWPKPQLDGNMPPEVRIKLAANLRAALHEDADITEAPL